MFIFAEGDIFESNAECIVNTVNCEGFMGKGIAYQFKLRYPQNNKEYIKACKNGTLHIGKLSYTIEQGKIIINFPTKDKWRAKSKIEYIHKGLKDLVGILALLEVKSIAIPPLGCGNGGLNWSEVKKIIIEYLTPYSQYGEVFIYEPSKNYNVQNTKTPKLNVSHLVLMILKLRLKKFNRFRLQKAVFFMSLFYGKDDYEFSKDKCYSGSIEMQNKEIKTFQNLYGHSTKEALSLAKTMITSERVEHKLAELELPINNAVDFMNKICNDEELELLSDICFLLQAKMDLTTAQIQSIIMDGSGNANSYSESDIRRAIRTLEQNNLLYKNLLGLVNLVRIK